MGRPPHRDSRETRQAILDAALELFATHGYYGTSLREIAAAVKIRDSAIYYHFASKEALFEAITAERVDSRQAIAAFVHQPVADVATFLEQLTMMILEQFQGARDRKLFRILLSDGVRLHAEGRLDFIERVGLPRLVALMGRLADDGWLAPANAPQRALQFVAPLLVRNVVDAARPSPLRDDDARAFARAHVEQFLHGAAAPAHNPDHRRSRR